MFNSQVWYRYHKSDSPNSRRINSTINSQSFWKDTRKTVNIMKLVLKVFRLVNGDKKSTMNFLYEAIKLMKNAVNDATYRNSKGYLKIIDERWSRILLHLLHEVGKQFEI